MIFFKNHPIEQKTVQELNLTQDDFLVLELKFDKVLLKLFI